MKMTIRQNVHTPYSLHDMNVIELLAADDGLTLRTQSGMVQTTPPYAQTDGYIEFRGVRWDYSYVYLLEHNGNIGSFQGEKLSLLDFIQREKVFGFSIMDETFGFNQTKLNGYLSMNRHFYECILEIYHEGDMVYITEEA